MEKIPMVNCKLSDNNKSNFEAWETFILIVIPRQAFVLIQN